MTPDSTPKQNTPATRATLVVAALVVMVGLSSAARAEELATEACLACHDDKTLVSGERSLYTDPAAFQASAHAPFSCTTCHTDVTEIPHPEHLQPVRSETVCTTCHADAVAAYQESGHAKPPADGRTKAVGCADCHGNVHAIKPHTEPDSAAHWSHLATACAKCHAKVALTADRELPVVRPVEAYQASVHARLVAAGTHGAVCSDCHGSHNILGAADPRSPIAHRNVPATCGTCHTEILASYEKSVHGEALARGHRGVPVCTDCHGEHRILGVGDPTSPVFAANVPSDTCGRCHGDERLSEKYGLSFGKVAEYRDSFHGLALRTGQVTVANCASCHGVHDIRPSSDPQSHVHAANLSATCGKCHPGAGEAFAIGSVHGTATSSGARGVAWVRFVYLWVIGLAVGFMALRNIIDLAHKARHPYRSPRPQASHAAERFPRPLRWQHGIVMISFPLLVVSGFALTYPESWWAAPLLKAEQRILFRGAFHRCAAVALVIALAWHVVHLASSRRLRACLRGLVPAWRDVIGVAHDLRLVSQPPPPATFNYAEKLEYWAFIWGALLMSVTGLLLWFESVTLRYLPGWTPDVATAIHFYEAILAALSILVWHLYFVVFDPEVYPMDWSWWDGHPPASRSEERRVHSEAEGD